MILVTTISLASTQNPRQDSVGEWKYIFLLRSAKNQEYIKTKKDPRKTNIASFLERKGSCKKKHCRNPEQIRGV
jgi:hypothetical protein